MDTDATILGRDWRNDADLEAPELRTDFEEVTNFLAQKCPVAHSPVGTGYWIANGFENVRYAAQNYKEFTAVEGFMPNAAPDTPVLLPQQLDPPLHTRWRQAMSPYLTPRAVRGHEHIAVEVTHQLIDGFIERGTCDFMEEFAGPFPGHTFFPAYLGVPIEDLERLREAVALVLFAPTSERTQGWMMLNDYLDQHLRRRANEEPRGDIVDAVLAGVELDSGEPAPWEDKVAVLSDIVAGGLGTTAYSLGSIFRFLADHPDERHRLASDESIHTRAIEELIRAHPATVAVGRTATRDLEFGGEQIAKGDMVMLNFASACLDPAVVEDPLRIDIDREVPVNGAFGFGAHRCPGTHLARMNLTTVMREFLLRIPDFEVTPGTAPTFASGIAREMYSLNLTFAPGRKRDAS